MRTYHWNWLGALVLLAGGAGLAGCGDSTDLGGPVISLNVAGGDGQEGAAGADLPLELKVIARDANGQPVLGTTVTWAALDGGTITPATSVSDPGGAATAHWRLGGGDGLHVARAMVPGHEPVAFTAVTLGTSALPAGVLVPIGMDTYDGSGQVVHPDVASVPDTWPGGPLRLGITPYPNGNPAFENPSLYGGADGRAWLVPPGVGNPVVPRMTGYNSDPDILYNPDAGELWLYYRRVTSANEILVIRSGDGVTWTAPRQVASAPNHDIISPTVVRRAAGDWWMWSVNGRAAGCSAADAALEVRRSSDGLHWSAPVAATLSQPGVFPWHVDVEWIPSRGEFWAVFNGKTAGSCTTRALYLATSVDGVTWQTYASPLLARGASQELQDIVYRSSFMYDAAEDQVTFWFSGARFDGSGYVWGAAAERLGRTDVFARITALPAPALGGPGSTGQADSPPLTDWP